MSTMRPPFSFTLGIATHQRPPNATLVGGKCLSWQARFKISKPKLSSIKTISRLREKWTNTHNSLMAQCNLRWCSDMDWCPQGNSTCPEWTLWRSSRRRPSSSSWLQCWCEISCAWVRTWSWKTYEYDCNTIANCLFVLLQQKGSIVFHKHDYTLAITNPNGNLRHGFVALGLVPCSIEPLTSEVEFPWPARHRSYGLHPSWRLPSTTMKMFPHELKWYECASELEVSENSVFMAPKTYFSDTSNFETYPCYFCVMYSMLLLSARWLWCCQEAW